MKPYGFQKNTRVFLRNPGSYPIPSDLVILLNLNYFLHRPSYHHC